MIDRANETEKRIDGHASVPDSEPKRRPWETPRIIVATAYMTDTGPGTPVDDGSNVS